MNRNRESGINLHREERETYAIERFWNHAFCVDQEEWMKKSEEYSEYK